MAHIHKDIDFTVEVFIVYEGKVLMRYHEKYNVWLSVGGHVELDEDPVQAAYREVEEEAGMKIEIINHLDIPQMESERYKELIPPRFLNRNKINEEHTHVTMTYFALAKSDKINPQEGETDKFEWFNMEDLENRKDELLPQIYIYAKEALKALS